MTDELCVACLFYEIVMVSTKPHGRLHACRGTTAADTAAELGCSARLRVSFDLIG